METPGLRDLCTGTVDLGPSAARGNARTNLFTITANASRETRTDKTAAYFNQVYSSALVDGVSAATAEAIRGGWLYNQNINSRTLWNLFNDYEYDRFQNLDLRVVLGGGLDYTMIKHKRKRLDLLGGAAYNREEFSTPLIRNSAEALLGRRFHLQAFGARLNCSSVFAYFITSAIPGSYRINFEMSIGNEPEEVACLAFDAQRSIPERTRRGSAAKRCALHDRAAIGFCTLGPNTVESVQKETATV